MMYFLSKKGEDGPKKTQMVSLSVRGLCQIPTDLIAELSVSMYKNTFTVTD